MAILLRAVGSLLLISLSLGEPASAVPRPDILLIMPDQMRGDCMSVVGHPTVRTPTIDRLAKEGVLFRRAYATVPSCIPARYALMTGLYPQTSGVVGFRKKPVNDPTLPQLLKQAGYNTALVGREMHQLPDAKQLGYATAVLGSTYASDDDYAADLRRALPGVTNIRKWVNSIGLTYNHWQAKPWPLANELHPTTWIITKSREFLAKAPVDEPVFLTASFYAPHPPLFPPKPYYDRMLQRDLPQPAHGDWVNWKALSPKGDRPGHRVLLKGNRLRNAQAGYYGLIEHLDHELAPLVKEFKRRSEAAARPWIIVFTTDHGEMMGDHGYYRKCEPFEGSANIPMILCGSSDMTFQTGARSQEPVCLEDVLPTVLEAAGAKCPPVDGRSLLPAARGDKEEIRDTLHFEHAPCYGKPQAFHAMTDGRWKYIWRPYGGREHLFDLDSDPREEHDLAKEPSLREQLEQWRARMIKRLAGRPEGFSDGTRLIPGRPYRPLQRGTRHAAKKEP